MTTSTCGLPLVAALVFAAATFGGVLALFIVVGALLFLGWALSVVYRVFRGETDAGA
ncbi:MAG: hypothetical protein Q8P18_21320 [Pseudomonadota bacterium]|nr:hypothetical protein [Pseudomonadota bacterium]